MMNSVDGTSVGKPRVRSFPNSSIDVLEINPSYHGNVSIEADDDKDVGEHERQSEN